MADGLHSISVPALVRPNAPFGEQNAPGCTPARMDLVVVVVVVRVLDVVLDVAVFALVVVLVVDG